MQFLGPNPKGMCVKLLILSLFSGRKRSGLNSSGASQYWGSWWMLQMGKWIRSPGLTITSVPGTLKDVGYVHRLARFIHG